MEKNIKKKINKQGRNEKGEIFNRNKDKGRKGRS
jgi:hypothetical protein